MGLLPKKQYQFLFLHWENDKAVGSKDAPFLTVNRAIEQVKILRKNKDSNLITIYLQKGTYYIQTFINNTGNSFRETRFSGNPGL